GSRRRSPQDGPDSWELLLACSELKGKSPDDGSLCPCCLQGASSPPRRENGSGPITGTVFSPHWEEITLNCAKLSSTSVVYVYIRRHRSEETLAMSAAWIQMLNSGTTLWLAAMARACGPGSLGLFLVWAAVRLWPGLSPGTRSWLWRLAYLKLLVALLGPAPLDLPLLPVPAVAFVAAPTSHSTVSA